MVVEGARTATRQRVARNTLTREDILATTLELIEADPDAPITMERVATAMGTRPMSLYTHVRNRDDLIDGAVDRSFRSWSLELPSPEDDSDTTAWEQELRTWCRSLRNHAQRYSPLIQEMLRNGSFQPALLEKVALLIRSLRRAGLEGRDLAEALRWIPQTVLGAITLELTRPDHLRSVADETAAILGSLAGLDDEARAEFLAVLPHYAEPDLDDLFDYSVDRLIDGVRTRVAHAHATGEREP